MRKKIRHNLTTNKKMAEKINIISAVLKKELGPDKKIWTVKFLHNGIEEKTGECFSKTEPTLGEQEADVSHNSQYNRWDVKLKQRNGGSGGGGFGKASIPPEERQAEREQISRNSGLNYAMQLLNAGNLEIPADVKKTDAIIGMADKFSKFILNGKEK